MNEKTIKVSGVKGDKEFVRENKHIALSTTGFSSMQMNMFVRSLTLFDLKPEEIIEEMRYLVEFQRKDIPSDGYKASQIREELEALQNITIRSNSESGWSSLKPFPKVGEYNGSGGTIQIWFDGEYLKPILDLKEKEGWAVYLVAEMFSLQGAYPKKLFSVFSSIKNLNNTRLEYEVDVLKKMLGIIDKYKNNPSMLMKKIIIPAVEQINTKTSLQVKVALRRRKGRTPTMIIFDVHKQAKLSGKSQSKSTPEDEPLAENERKMKQYFTDNFPDDKPYRCFLSLKDLGFEQQQAYNCAINEKTMKLFYKWKFDKGVDVKIKDGEIEKSYAKLDFFKELKDKKLRI